jgi:hypothetical protein
MALATLQSGLKVKRRVLQFSGIDGLGPGVVGVSSEAGAQMRTFFETMGQLKGNPDLVLIPFDELSATESGNSIFSDSACTLYAIYLRKDTATATWSKFQDHATVVTDASPTFSFKSARVGDEFHCWPSGLALATGLVAQGNTDATTGTTSGSNGAKGFVILGAA